MFLNGPRCNLRRKTPSPRRWVAPSLGISLWLLSPVASARAQAQATPEETAAGQSFYLIGIGDVIGVHVWKEPDLSTKGIIVRPDGRISLPLVGDVQAAGLSAPGLAEIVTDKLKEFITDPHVSVLIETINSYHVYILGHINKSGTYFFQRPTRLVEALATAGGFDQYADSSHLVVLSSRSTGGQVRIEVDFKKIVSGARLDGNIYLRPGDTVIVP